MNLTPEERILRDSYLAKRRLDSYVFDLALISISAGAFIIGLSKETDGTALIVVGYALPLVSIVRHLYYTLTYTPHIRSLIQKYEQALKTVEKTDAEQKTSIL